MRMRRKKYLDERMENAGDYILAVENEEFYSKSEEDKYCILNFEKIFGNNNPVSLELGCGKGGFAREIAKRNQDKNYIAVEKLSNVIIGGVEQAKEENLKNLRFLNVGVENLGYFISPMTVESIYLNFSCPYPKNSYANRRLTSPRFLKLYKILLKKEGVIFQKTDNMRFFEYSLENFSLNGYYLKNISLDLYNSGIEDNIQTEYEKKFVDRGLPIYRLEAYIEK